MRQKKRDMRIVFVETAMLRELRSTCVNSTDFANSYNRPLA
jgi:hypothetical protein